LSQPQERASQLAREHFIKAKQMVEELGYHRRDKEVAELEKELLG